ncbi:S26 family signal peptidase [Acidiphilium acidophilum]|uniref:S26 family signal peptidase n=1 Tax=Acidiphilium acidophilum TaxID=76588 RepID=UPI002E8E70F0|nr:S26 family signal peptidase [Acidiphilium acidophilum]
MRVSRSKSTYILAGLLAVGVLADVALVRSGLIINVTPSMPIGLYRLSSLPRRLHDGMIVYLCPPSPARNLAMAQAAQGKWLLTSPRSPCPSHLVPFLKKIGATPGQTVTLTMRGTSIDGHLLPATAIKRFAKNGQPMIHQKPGSYLMGPRQVWVWDNSSPWAYDSRYWGPLPVANILKQARPVLTW